MRGTKRKKLSPSQFRPRKKNAVHSDDEIICTGQVIVISSGEEDANTSSAHLKRIEPPKQSGGSTNLTVKPVIKSDAQSDDFRQINRVKTNSPRSNGSYNSPIVVDSSGSEGGEQETNDEDYEELYDGYQVGWNIDSRLSVEPDSLYEVDALQTAVSQLCLDSISNDINGHQQHPRTLQPYHQWKEVGPHQKRAAFSYKWKNLILDHVLPRSVPSRTALYSPRCFRTALLHHGRIHDLVYLQYIRQTNWSIMADVCSSLSQAEGKILFASSTPGGQPDNGEDMAISRDNDSKTLALWTTPNGLSDTGWTWLKDHHRLSDGRYKHYDINCARFDPVNPNVYVSTGSDGYLAINRLLYPSAKDQSSRIRALARWKASELPETYCRDIVFKPCVAEHTTFAAPGSNGQVFLCTYTPSEGQDHLLSISHSKITVSDVCEQRPGATVWGFASTADQLFICGESVIESNEARHYSFDANTGEQIYSFDETGSGEELAISHTGDQVALFTTQNKKLFASLYDVRGKTNHLTAKTQLPCPTQLPGNLLPEVRSVRWSTDEIMLAVGTNDDMVHVYDTRQFSAPILALQYKAETPDVPTSEYGYGITVLEWSTTTSFRTPRPGIFAGGNHKTLVFWDVKTACREPRVIAKLENPISVGNFGDSSKGEKPLVLGDIAGRVFIYDFGFVPT